VNPGEGAYKWDGSECIWVDPACGCTGTDCENLFQTKDACDGVYANCEAGPDNCCMGPDAVAACGDTFMPGESCEDFGGGRCCDTSGNLWGCNCGEACGTWYEASCP
jgi:hypothetical protein